MLQQILDQMWVDPELLAELSKEQKEVLFHKIRQEQMRRWNVERDGMEKRIASRPPRKPRLRFSEFADMFDDDEDAITKQASKRLKELEKLEKEREKQQQLEDERQAHILAQVQIEQEMQRQQALAEELKRKEEESKRRLAEEQAKARAAAMEREQYMSMKEARLAAEAEAKRVKELEEAAKKEADAIRKEQERIAEERAKAEKNAKTIQAKKEKELYLSMQEVRQIQKKKQEEEEARMEKNFQEQEKAAKLAEEEKRQAVQKARELARQSSSALVQLEQNLVSKKPDRYSKPLPPPVGAAATSSPPKNPPERQSSFANKTATLTGKAAGLIESRPDRPSTEQDVINWFRSDERPRGAGRDARGKLQPWFHGLISREDTERMLASEQNGAFLVRVSSRIWGYTISFVESGKVKHFLVDVVDGQYTVFSSSTRAHADLNTLIAFHMRFPITKMGTMLTKGVGDPQGNRSLAALMS